jgi:hypothetical protein
MVRRQNAATEIDSLDVRWPDDTTSTLPHVNANQIVKIRQPR